MTDILGIYLFVGAMIVVGVLIFCIIAKLLTQQIEKPTRSEKLEEEHYNKDAARTGERRRVLSEAMRHPVGSYERKRLMAKYETMATDHEIRAKRERKEIVREELPMEGEIQELRDENNQRKSYRGRRR